MTSKFKILLAAIAGAAVAQAAAAQTASPQVRERYSLDGQHIVAETAIPLAGLDLASPQGVRTLLDRIQAAADLVCAGTGPQLASVEIECRAQAVRDAVARAGSPALNDLAAREARRP
jgi:UrcA family protein